MSQFFGGIGGGADTSHIKGQVCAMVVRKLLRHSNSWKINNKIAIQCIQCQKRFRKNLEKEENKYCCLSVFWKFSNKQRPGWCQALVLVIQWNKIKCSQHQEYVDQCQPWFCHPTKQFLFENHTNFKWPFYELNYVLKDFPHIWPITVLCYHNHLKRS